MASTKTQHFWTEEETRFMLRQLHELNILKYMDGRKTRNGELFKKVEKRMEEAGFTRASEQIRVRWKNIKQSYNSAKNNKSSSGHCRVTCPYSDLLDKLLGRRTLRQTGQHGVDVGFGPTEPDALQNSTAPLQNSSPAPLQNSSPAPLQNSSPAPLQNSSPTPLQNLSPAPLQNASPAPLQNSSPAPLQNSSPTPLQNSPSTPSGHRHGAPSDLPGTSTQGSGRRRRDVDVERVLLRIEAMNSSWQQQLQRSEEREERLVNSIIQSNASVVSAILDAMRSFRSPTPAYPHVPPSQSSMTYPHVPPSPSPMPSSYSPMPDFHQISNILGGTADINVPKGSESPAPTNFTLSPQSSFIIKEEPTSEDEEDVKQTNGNVSSNGF